MNKIKANFVYNNKYINLESRSLMEKTGDSTP